MDKTIQLTWTQVLPSPNDLASWEVRVSQSLEGSYTLLDTVPFVVEQAEYTADVVVTNVPAGQVTTYYFKMRALDGAGNPSVVSNVVSVEVDMAAPNAPVITGATLL